jgi:hypothetical protein
MLLDWTWDDKFVDISENDDGVHALANSFDSTHFLWMEIVAVLVTWERFVGGQYKRVDFVKWFAEMSGISWCTVLPRMLATGLFPVDLVQRWQDSCDVRVVAPGELLPLYVKRMYREMVDCFVSFLDKHEQLPPLVVHRGDMPPGMPGTVMVSVCRPHNVVSCNSMMNLRAFLHHVVTSNDVALLRGVLDGSIRGTTGLRIDVGTRSGWGTGAYVVELALDAKSIQMVRMLMVWSMKGDYLDVGCDVGVYSKLCLAAAKLDKTLLEPMLRLGRKDMCLGLHFVDRAFDDVEDVEVLKTLIDSRRVGVDSLRTLLTKATYRAGGGQYVNACGDVVSPDTTKWSEIRRLLKDAFDRDTGGCVMTC